MEQKTLRKTVWEHFADDRLVLAGIKGDVYLQFLENLKNLSEQPGMSFAVEEGLEQVKAGDFVFLFSKISDASDCWGQEIELLEAFSVLQKRRPAAVLLVSGSEIYGKQYGQERALREDEIGYICHTRREEIPAQCMRTSEHFACRFAKEEGLPVKVARLGAWPADSASVAELLDTAARVLLFGTPGEAYNLTDAGEGDNDRHSPLQAIPVRMNTAKAKELET